jgi:cell division protein FtsL
LHISPVVVLAIIIVAVAVVVAQHQLHALSAQLLQQAPDGKDLYLLSRPAFQGQELP